MLSEKCSLSLSCSSEEAPFYSMSSPTSFSLLKSSIFVSTNDVSKGSEQTALIPPFLSDKTGFTMINHSGQSFPANPEPFYLSLKLVSIAVLCCCILFVIACDQQNHLYFYGMRHFLIEVALLSSLLSFQEQLHCKLPLLRFS